MNLSEALQIRPGVTAIIGGGGKTTLMERLAHELSGKARVIVCTTTHIYPEKTMPCLVSPAQAEIAAALEKSPCICVGAWSENGKFGPPELPVGTLARLADYVIVEADGSKRLPAKAHAAWEPVLPPERSRTVCVFGASALGQPIQDAAHRPELYASLAEVSPEAVITPAIAARVLAKEGGFDVLFINQADVLEDPAAALQPLVYTLPCPAIYGALAEGYWAKL